MSEEIKNLLDGEEETSTFPGAPEEEAPAEEALEGDETPEPAAV